ncbi:MAG: tetratricopeptide repeat protein [Bacteroidota bacterium]
MKRLLLIVTLASVVNIGFAQKVKYPKGGKCLASYKKGELTAARDCIDLAVQGEKGKNDGKTWYYRGLIYAALDTTSVADFQNVANNPLQIAMDAFAKADELQKGDNEFYIANESGLPDLKSQQIDRLWGTYLNQGVEAYQAQDEQKAIAAFKKCTIVKKEDTTAYLYLGSAAQGIEEYDLALESFNKYLEFGGTDPAIDQSVIYIVGNVKKDTEKALELTRKAKAKHPGHNGIAKQEIDFLIKLNKIDEAKAGLEQAIASEPDNPILYFQLAFMYEETDDKEKAKENYVKSLEADPNYFNSLYNLAVLYYNEAAEITNEKNGLGITSADLKKAEELQGQIMAKLEEALPHWEKVNQIQPEDRQGLETLKYIYLQLKMNDKAEAVTTKLEALGEEGQ